MAIEVSGLAPLLQVFDMPKSLAFYGEVLGFEVVERSGESDECDWVLLRLNRAEIMLNTAYEKSQRPLHPSPERLAAHQDVTIYFGCPDVEGVYQLLREKGIEVNEPSIAPYGMKQLYFKDPDGYGLCFQWPATDETRAKWMERYGIADR